MRTLALVIAIVGLAVSLPVTPGIGAAPAAIQLGAVIPLSGRYGGGGAQIRAGYQFAVADINRAGGVSVGGQKIPLALTILDDGSDATKTVSQFETLGSQGSIVFLGGFGSDLHAAAAAVAEKDKIPYCGVAFALHSVHEQGFKYLFSPFPKSPQLAVETYRALNASIPAGQRPTRVAIFEERTDWGREMADNWTARSQEYGYQVVLRAQYSPGAQDLSDIILRAKSAGANAVFALPTPPDGITMIRQMKQLDFSPQLAVIVRAADAVTWSQALGKDGDDVLLMPGWHHSEQFPGVTALNAEHQAQYGRPADVVVGPAYACVQIVANAIQRAGKLDSTAIRDAMASTNMMTVEGPVKFRPDGTGIVPTVIVQWQNGQQQMVWPKNLGGIPMIYPAPAWRAR
ncbi:MAG TPA: amino acid ABC transporter substrate-binding protein [bacterium]|nr:amino acid ABC transporter substrate-binding protein [bacterium]